ncbi:MAG: UPF0175 family protein [Armatimonadota bacterium]|nr:UPF0175 family protein [Armatimonadota bacterium]
MGKARELVDYSKRALIELLSRQKIPIVSYSPEELE